WLNESRGSFGAAQCRFNDISSMDVMGAGALFMSAEYAVKAVIVEHYGFLPPSLKTHHRIVNLSHLIGLWWQLPPDLRAYLADLAPLDPNVLYPQLHAGDVVRHAVQLEAPVEVFRDAGRQLRQDFFGRFACHGARVPWRTMRGERRVATGAEPQGRATRKRTSRPSATANVARKRVSWYRPWGEVRMPRTTELGKIPAVDLAYAINRLIQ